MKYNRHFQDHFRSCQLLKTGHDPHRNRRVEIRFIPGEYEVVGITDGTDAWVAPVSTGFLEDVRKLLERIRAGDRIEPIYEAPKKSRERVKLSDEVIAPLLDGTEKPRRERVRIA